MLHLGLKLVTEIFLYIHNYSLSHVLTVTEDQNEMFPLLDLEQKLLTQTGLHLEAQLQIIRRIYEFINGNSNSPSK